MKNHVKQMCRKPLQLLLMIVLIMIVTVMLVAGGNLWVTSDRISKAYEDDFITIGTVTQKPDAVAEEEEWDAERKDYLFYKRGRYRWERTVRTSSCRSMKGTPGYMRDDPRRGGGHVLGG